MKTEPLPPKLHLLLIAIISYIDIVGTTPTQQALADVLCVARNTIGDWMRELRLRGFIRRDSKGGAIEVLKYSVPDTDNWAVSKQMRLLDLKMEILKRKWEQVDRRIERMDLRLTKLERGVE